MVGPIFPKLLAQLVAAAMAGRGRPVARRLKVHALGAAAAALVEGHLRDGHQLLLWSAAWAEVNHSPIPLCCLKIKRFLSSLADNLWLYL